MRRAVLTLLAVLLSAARAGGSGATSRARSRATCAWPEAPPAPTSTTSAPASRFRLARRHAAHPGVEHEAVHLGAALTRFGPDGTLGTEVLGDGQLAATASGAATSTCRAAVTHLRLEHFTRKFYGGGATVQQLAKLIDAARASRGSPATSTVTSRATTRCAAARTRATACRLGRAAQRAVLQPRLRDGERQRLPDQPAGLRGGAARRCARGARYRGRRAGRCARRRRGLDVLASVDSPPMARIIKLMNKPSDNFFAEMLAKDVAMQVNGRGTTSAGRR